MRVVVCGPNLRDQSKGTFHVHKHGCKDLAKYGPYKPKGGEDGGWEIDAVSRDEVVLEVYDPSDFEYDGFRDPNWDLYYNDFWFAPCCKELR